VLAVTLAACGQRETIDTITSACFTAPTELPGILSVRVTASGGEQAPHDGSCVLEDDVDGVRLSTSFFFDHDSTPFADTFILTFGSVSCGQEVDGGDPIVVLFRDQALELPVDGAEHCFQWNGTSENGELVPGESPLL
jgi:hypothetical protein